uniref:Uncharacterized protein n=1 Tax=Rhizophora mucronata TaxID=61149 RepID=A0A2P2NJB5_RHIMU
MQKGAIRNNRCSINQTTLHW